MPFAETARKNESDKLEEKSEGRETMATSPLSTSNIFAASFDNVRTRRGLPSPDAVQSVDDYSVDEDGEAAKTATRLFLPTTTLSPLTPRQEEPALLRHLHQRRLLQLQAEPSSAAEEDQNVEPTSTTAPSAPVNPSSTAEAAPLSTTTTTGCSVFSMDEQPQQEGTSGAKAAEADRPGGGAETLVLHHHQQLPLEAKRRRADTAVSSGDHIEHDSEEAIAMKAKEQLMHLKLNVGSTGSIKSYDTKNAPTDPYMVLYRRQQADAEAMCCCLF